MYLQINLGNNFVWRLSLNLQMSTPVIYQTAYNSCICLLTKALVAFTMHVPVHEMNLDFVQDIFSKAFAGDWSVQDGPLKVKSEYLCRF